MIRKKRLQRWKDYELIATSLRYLHTKHQKEADENIKTFKDAMDFVSIYNEVEFQFMRLIHKYKKKADRIRKKMHRETK